MIMNHTKQIAIALIFLIGSLANAQHGEEAHTDGLEKYSHPEKLTEYLDKIDPTYLPYLFTSEEDMKWWKEAKFGVFVHWAPAVVNEKSLSWAKIGKPHHRRDGEGGIPDKEYCDTYKTFNPTKFNAEEWVKLWKEAGAKYFVFTSKHHYGFCMWDTKTTDFNVMNTPYGKDVIKELTDACHKYKMRILFYYSQPDWTDPLYRGNKLPSKEFNTKILYPQLTELMNNYGKIDGIWFDGLGKHPETWGSGEMMKIIKTANPKAIVNHRFGPKSMNMGDFDGPERGIGRFQINRPWETCDIIGGGWGYMGEKPAMPIASAIKLVTKIAGNGGNLLLNTGPRPDGSIIESHVKRFKEIGQYLSKYGESIYATQGGPYMPGAWGSSTYKGNKVWLHVMGHLKDDTFSLPKLPATIKSSKVLTGGTVIVTNKKQLTVQLNKDSIDSINTIIELVLDKSMENTVPMKTTGEAIYTKAKISASSVKNPSLAASNLLPGANTTFTEGIKMKDSWAPSRKDSQPWLLYEWDSEQELNQIFIQEGKRIGGGGKITDFQIDVFTNGKWANVYKGDEIRALFSLMLNKPMKVTKLKIQFNKASGVIEINKIELY